MSWKQKAYDKLLNDGWIQGQAISNGECCAGGAIAWAITGDPKDMYSDENNNYDEVRPALVEFAMSVGVDERGCFCGDPECGVAADVQVIVWNDANGRTEEEVLEAFRKLAEAEVASTT